MPVPSISRPFQFRVYGKILRVCFMPPRGVLYARNGAAYDQDGHTQRLSLAGRQTAMLHHPIIHDDRKPLTRWLESQRKYAVLEADKLRATPDSELNLPDRLRRTGWANVLVILPYALLLRGLIWDGLPGLLYGHGAAVRGAYPRPACAARKVGFRQPLTSRQWTN